MEIIIPAAGAEIKIFTAGFSVLFRAVTGLIPGRNTGFGASN
jgi:hypothetical protein